MIAPRDMELNHDNILFQKCRTVESDGRTINLLIVSIPCELCAKSVVVVNSITIVISPKRDTAGQERFQSNTGSIFRDANGIFIAYDVTEQVGTIIVRSHA